MKRNKNKAVKKSGDKINIKMRIFMGNGQNKAEQLRTSKVETNEWYDGRTNREAKRLIETSRPSRRQNEIR